MATKFFTVTSSVSGLELGTYRADSKEEALERLALDAGYPTFAAACEAVGYSEGELIVEEADEEVDGGECGICGEPARLRRCEECGEERWVIDCGHYAQPRPIAAGADGRMLCDDCAE